MAFTDPLSLKQRGAGMAGALIIPGALGALFISSLAVTGVVKLPPMPRPQGVNIPLPPPPPPPEPEQAKPERATSNSQVYTPPRRLDVAKPDFTLDTTEVLPPPGDRIDTIVLPPLDDIGPPVRLPYKPVGVSPRNDPGSWVTADDYRSSWINRELTGSAKFDLTIASNGRVTGCRITQSTGHSALDEATCALIAKRARFTPATDAAGKPVAGSYSSSIRWVLPD